MIEFGGILWLAKWEYMFAEFKSVNLGYVHTNKSWTLFLHNLFMHIFSLKDTLKASEDFKNNQKIV